MVAFQRERGCLAQNQSLIQLLLGVFITYGLNNKQGMIKD